MTKILELKNYQNKLNSILTNWRKKTVQTVLVVSSVVSFFMIVALIAKTIIHQHSWVLPGVLIALFLMLVTITVLKFIDYRIRASIILGIIYLAGIISMFRGGLAGSGRLYLFALPILAVLLLNIRAGIIVTILSSATILLFITLSGFELADQFLIYRDNPTTPDYWIPLGIDTLALINVTVILVIYFHKLLLETMNQQRHIMKRMNRILEEQVAQRTDSLKRANQELVLLMREVEQANDAKTQFLANTSHELRTPLNGILGFTEILLDLEDAEEKREILEIIKQSGDLLCKLLNDLLDLSKIEAGQIQINQESFSLQERGQYIADRFQVAMDQKGLAFQVEIDPELPVTVIGDHVKMTQICDNLLSNALKFTDSGEISFTIKGMVYQYNIVSVLFTVKDSGIGIDDQKRSMIFDSFRQEEDHLTRKYGGTGLGLAIVKKLVDLMGGGIDLKSEKGVGSTFTVEIPFEYQQDKTNEEMLEEDTMTSVNGAGKIHILLGEDNPTNQLLIRKIVEKRGWLIDIVDNGEKVIQQITERDYDLILMDVQMPVMNGYEATRLIREMEKSQGKHTPIIAVTAFAMKGDREKSIEAGMDDYISKPIRQKLFFEVIERYIKGD